MSEDWSEKPPARRQAALGLARAIVWLRFLIVPAFAMAVELLLDTLLARTLLIPALVSLIGSGRRDKLEPSAASSSSSH